MDQGFTVYDDASNPINLPIKPEEVSAVLEAKTKLEEEHKLAQEELKKYKDKEFNFNNLRSKSEEEKKEIIEKMNAKERALWEEVESMRKERDEDKTRQYNEAQDAILEQLAGSDEEKKQKISTFAKEFVGEPKSIKELEERLRKAATLADGIRPTVNPIHRYTPSSNFVEPNQPKKYTETEVGKSNYSSWFKDSKIK